MIMHIETLACITKLMQQVHTHYKKQWFTFEKDWCNVYIDCPIGVYETYSLPQIAIKNEISDFLEQALKDNCLYLVVEIEEQRELIDNKIHIKTDVNWIQISYNLDNCETIQENRTVYNSID